MQTIVVRPGIKKRGVKDNRRLPNYILIKSIIFVNPVRYKIYMLSKEDFE
jgi:hypothetical protein